MNLKELHTENKAVQTNLLLKAEEGKVISLQILKNEKLKEHISTVPAILLCVFGKGIYKDEFEQVTLKKGDYVFIKANVKHEVTAVKTSNFILVK